jgi:HPt (histidine-containing phosphotransfer) domain-containing protein
MGRLHLVTDADVPVQLLADRLRVVGHWVPPRALEAAVDAAVQAGPPGVLTAVRTRLAELGCEDGPEERAMFAGLLELFAARGPEALARVEAAVDAGDAPAAATAARRLARQAEALDAAPLARLCTAIADRAASGDATTTCAERAALRRELTVTCCVVGALAAELRQDSAGTAEGRRGRRAGRKALDG